MAGTTSTADCASQMTMMMIMMISYHVKHRSCKCELQDCKKWRYERESATRSGGQERRQLQAPQPNDDLQNETQTRRQNSVPLFELPETIFMIPANNIMKYCRWWKRYSSKHKCI